LFSNFFAGIKKVILSLDPKDRILEVGCGAGISSLKIYEMLEGQEFEISDNDQRYIQKIRGKSYPMKATQESVYELKRSDNEFDCIFMLQVMEHLENHELALQELFRVSRKWVVISVPNEPLWRILNMLRGKYIKNFGNTPGHINHWSSRRLVSLLSRYGDVVKVYTPVPWIVTVARVCK
jgi:ubiquinone/menaquinone biosynthesis C-methylase UbiE